jgi:adenylate kinase
MIVLIIGPQGAGKGTVASRMALEFGLVHISTGDLLRAEAKSGSPLGAKIAALIDAGKLIDDALMLDILEKRLLLPDARQGVLLDGYPRNIKQAKALNERMEVRCVLLLDAPDELCVKRIASRWQCKQCNTIYGIEVPPKKQGVCDKCGGELFRRADDEPDAVRKRLALYHKATAPILKLFKDKIKRIDASQKLDAMLRDSRQALQECRSSGE